MDGELKLTQSFAILKYLARKHGLSGVTDDEKIRLDLIEAEANDLRYKWVVLCYLSDYVSAIVCKFADRVILKTRLVAGKNKELLRWTTRG